MSRRGNRIGRSRGLRNAPVLACMLGGRRTIIVLGSGRGLWVGVNFGLVSDGAQI
jgi:hypothetical protein